MTKVALLKNRTKEEYLSLSLQLFTRKKHSQNKAWIFVKINYRIRAYVFHEKWCHFTFKKIFVHFVVRWLQNITEHLIFLLRKPSFRLIIQLPTPVCKKFCPRLVGKTQNLNFLVTLPTSWQLMTNGAICFLSDVV